MFNGISETIKKRKLRKKKNGKHPSIVFAISDDGKYYYNLGITKSPRRGHHHNLEIHNPQNWDELSYVRNDLSVDEVELLDIVLKDYSLHPDDYKKIWDRIIKDKIDKK